MQYILYWSMLKHKNSTFYCFSPLVMVATVIIELGLLIFLVFRYMLSKIIALAAFLLLFLALFQMAEYGICEQLGFADTTWVKIGFASITMLPVLGLHLVYAIAGKMNKPLLLATYGASAVWILIFVFGNIMQEAVCTGNYVIFNFLNPWERHYFIFYDLIILIAMVQAIRFARETKHENTKKALHWLFFGYISFTVPAIVIWFITDGADMAMPSIMCGFAVIFAVIVGARVVPHSVKR